jgi:hypothetical protein
MRFDEDDEEDFPRPRKKKRRREEDEEDESEDRPRRKKKRQRELTGSRVYLHIDCETGTQVSGFDYVRLSDPFSMIVGETFCCGCGTHFPLGAFVWEDSGETITEWKRRKRSEAPGLLIVFRFFLFPLIGGVIGGVLGHVIGKANEVPDPKGALILGILGGAILFFLLSGFASRPFWRRYYND